MNDEENKKEAQTEAYEDSLEYLRARYLGRGSIDYGKFGSRDKIEDNNKQTATELNSDTSAQSDATAGDGAQQAAAVEREAKDAQVDNSGLHETAATDSAEDSDTLRRKYSSGGAVGSAGRRSRSRLACDIVLFCSVIIVFFATHIWFASPTVEVGGVTYKNGTQSLYAFLYGANNSVFNQIMASVDTLKSGISTDSVSAALKIYRLLFLAGVGIAAAINMLINLITAIIHFARKNSAKLSLVALNSVANKLIVYAFFVFFGSVSGGVGEDAYFGGYTVGTGMTVGVVIGFAALLAVCVVRFIVFRKQARAEELLSWRRSVVCAACYTAFSIILAMMRIYGVFGYTVTSTLTAVVGMATSFKIKALVFPFLNLLLFVSCMVILKRTQTGFSGAFTKLLNFGDDSLSHCLSPKQYNRLIKFYAMGFKLVIVFSALSVVAVLLLRTTTFGYGWSVDIYPHFVAMLAISACGQIANGLIFNNARKRKLNPVATAEQTKTCA